MIRFVVAAVFAFLCVQLGEAGYLLHDCSATLYDFGYMSYCDSPMTSYEHGGIYFGIEKTAVRFLKASDLIVLGNSRIQVALSTQEMRQFVEKQSLKYYLLGFSFNEKEELPLHIFDKYDIRPKAVIINVDPFFSTSLSMPAQQVLVAHQRDQYLFKYIAQLIHKEVCKLAPRVACSGSKMTVFRSRENGSWSYVGWVSSDSAPASKSVAVTEGQLSSFVQQARAFAQRLHLSPQCMIMTVVPSAEDYLEIGETVARRTGSPFVAPVGKDFHTIDGDHLNKSSAERWSAAFLNQIGPLLNRCGL